MVDKIIIERVDAVDRHRNGICGKPFNVVVFKSNDSPHRKVGIVFDEPEHVAVFDLDLFAAGNIKFGENSWRGDQYEGLLRMAIKIDGIQKEKRGPFFDPNFRMWGAKV